MRNPALGDLAVLIGDWRIDLTNADFLDDGAAMSGTMSVEWLDGAFIVMRSSMDHDGPPKSVCVIGRNEARSDYTLLYADERGVSRIYGMTLEDRIWIQHREDPGFHQRFQGTVDPGGNRIVATWTKSHEDVRTWEHDFDLTYTRL
jgi:hypothetical protein